MVTHSSLILPNNLEMLEIKLMQANKIELNMFELMSTLGGAMLCVTTSILLFQPFFGVALIRLRANYLPKAVSLSLEDGGSNAKIGPVVSGIWEMFQRTRRMEGLTGVYRGSTLALLHSFLLSIMAVFFFHLHGGLYEAPLFNFSDFRFWSSNLLFPIVANVVSLPLEVITYRCVVHPRSLPVNSPRKNLRKLLSPSELKHPWRLYLLPGLLSARFIRILWVEAGRIVRHSTLPPLLELGPGSEPDSPLKKVSFFGLSVFILWIILSIIVMAPLECAMVRLSIQRPERDEPLPQGVGNNSGPDSFNRDEPQEPVIASRPCDNPRSAEEEARAEAAGFGAPVVERYTGLFNCLKKMAEEEGNESLKRALWVTVVGVLGQSLV